MNDLRDSNITMDADFRYGWPQTSTNETHLTQFREIHCSKRRFESLVLSGNVEKDPYKETIRQEFIMSFLYILNRNDLIGKIITYITTIEKNPKSFS